MTRLPLSISIISLNEEANLRRCLASAAELAQEIVIVDSGSTDRTAEIAAEFGVKFVHQDWLGYTAQKNHCLALCSQPWILALDCDEELTPELRGRSSASLRMAITKNSTAHGCPASCGSWAAGFIMATGIPTAKCASSVVTRAAGPPMAAGRCMSGSMSMAPAPRCRAICCITRSKTSSTTS
jgi:glycosyltransferase involved in cell wall biosynthesis